MANLTLKQLLTSTNINNIVNSILNSLSSQGFPVTDWTPGGVERSIVYAFATQLLDLVNNAIPTITAGGSVDFAKGDWLKFLAQQRFDLDFIPASNTVGNVVISADSSSVTITDNQLTIKFPSGNRYLSLAGTSICAPTALTAPLSIDAVLGMTVTSTSAFTTGIIQIDDEQIQYALKDSTHFISLVRGLYGTTPATHDVDALVRECGIVQFQSEFPNDSLAQPPLNYADASANINETNKLPVLVTSLPGVTISNPAGQYAPSKLINSDASKVASQVKNSTGYIQLQGQNTPIVPQHTFTIHIVSAGNAHTCQWEYSIDGAEFVFVGADHFVQDLGGTGIDVTLIDTITDPADFKNFSKDDFFIWQAPGSWIVQLGRDEESDALLAQRCNERWTSIGNINTSGLYDLLVREASPYVVQTIVQADGYINNKVNVIIAGQSGPLPAGTVGDVQSYLSVRAPITDFPVVSTPEVVSIDGYSAAISATIVISTPTASDTKSAIQAAVANYLDALGINGTIRISEIIRYITDQAGVVDCYFVSVTTNPVITPQSNGNITLGPLTPQILSFTQDISVPSTYIKYVVV